MFRNKKVLLMFCIILTMVSVNCRTSVQLTTQQKRQITTQLVQGSYENIFAATLTVLQDRNCVIKKTDKTTGLIFAKEEVGSGSPAGEAAEEIAMIVGTIAQWFGADEGWTTTDDVTTVEVGCVLSKVDSTASQLRINTQESTLIIEESRGLLLTKHKEYKLKTQPIYDEAYYRKLFNEITVEVKRREAIN